MKEEGLQMVVIYHDVGGTHSTAVAANIHINKLPMDRIASKDEILNLPTFDKISKNQVGHILYIGSDEFDAKVYTISRKYKPNLVVPAIRDAFIIGGMKDEDIYIVDTHPTVNLWMKIGGFTSRALGVVSIGRPIVTYGTIKAYEDIAQIVKEVKIKLKSKN
jgi:hypothetical protein